MPGIIAMQFAAKVLGGAIWSALLMYRSVPKAPNSEPV
jgi:hypothetical protein